MAPFVNDDLAGGGMNVLVIMLYWYPYEGPLMPIYGALFEDLMAKGHNITIVTSFPHYRKGRSETWDAYRGKWIEISSWKAARLVRCYVYAPVFDSDSRGLFYRALNFISFNISCILAASLYGGKADVIFAPSSPPLTNGICSWLVSLCKRCPIVYNVQDMYPDMAEKLGVLRPGVLLSVLRRFEKWAYRVSNKILTISENMRKNLFNKGIAPDKIATIPNFIDTDFIRPMPQKNVFSEEWGINGRFVVMYAGNIGLPHGVEIIVRTAEILRSESRIEFCFVARGEYKDKIEAMAKSKALGNVRFVPPQPAEMVPHLWASASVSLVTYRKGMADESVPSKLLAIMCSGRPVIVAADEGSETERIIRSADCGLCIEPENPSALAAAILQLFRNGRERKRLGDNGRKYVVEHFRRDRISNEYEKLFLSVIKARG